MSDTTKDEPNIPSWTVALFTIALIYQAFHWSEHLLQMYQHFFLGLIVIESHGGLFFLDLEWNHFIFNVVYLSSLYAIFFGGRWHTRIRSSHVAQLFVLAIGIESWHLCEHIVRIYQHLTIGCEPCLGILGSRFDIIYLHGSYNTLTTLAPLSAYLAGGYPRKLWNLL
jgi:hypothetical protein